MNPLALLNEHLEMIQLAGKMYPKAKVDRVYNKLTKPRITGEFFDKDRVNARISESGEVSFETNYPELKEKYGTPWTHKSPEELQVGVKLASVS